MAPYFLEILILDVLFVQTLFLDEVLRVAFVHTLYPKQYASCNGHEDCVLVTLEEFSHGKIHNGSPSM
jgi:hypothetical protein